MNRKGFIDEVNPMFLVLALVGAFVSFLMTSRIEELGMFWKVLTPIATFAAVYFYLAETDN